MFLSGIEELPPYQQPPSPSFSAIPSFLVCALSMSLGTESQRGERGEGGGGGCGGCIVWGNDYALAALTSGVLAVNKLIN